MPFFLFAARVLMRNLLVLAHNVLVIVVVFVVFPIWPGWSALLAIPGLLLWALDALALVLLLGHVLRALPRHPAHRRQRHADRLLRDPGDLEAGAARHRSTMLPFNPFFDLLEIVRAPLLAARAGRRCLAGAGLYSALRCAACAWRLFTRARGRIAFWI